MHLLKKITISYLISLIFFLLLSVIYTLIIFNINHLVPVNTINNISFIISLIVSLLFGIFLSRTLYDYTFILRLLISFIPIILIFIISFTKAKDYPFHLYKYIIILLCIVTGLVIGYKKKQK